MKTESVVCKVCEKIFLAKEYGTGKARRMPVTCSISCRNALNGKNSNDKRDYGIRVCELCKKEFTAKTTFAKYCSRPCLQKSYRLAYPEREKARGRRKITRQQIGLKIRDEHLGQPTRDAKWLWDGIGKWSVKYWPDIQECLECNTNVYRHSCNGICEKCYDQLRPRDPEELKKWKKKAYEKAKALGKKFSADQSREWIEKAKNKKIPITPKIDNLLDNLERL